MDLLQSLAALGLAFWAMVLAIRGWLGGDSTAEHLTGLFRYRADIEPSPGVREEVSAPRWQTDRPEPPEESAGDAIATIEDRTSGDAAESVRTVRLRRIRTGAARHERGT